jgi:diguanylate cyclase (GGDEF)-like protein
MMSAGLLVCLVGTLVAYLLYASYQRYQRNVEQDTQNLALTMDSFLTSHFQSVDLALQSAANQFRQMHAERRFTNEAFSAYLVSLRQRLPNAVSVRGADRDGWVIFGEGIDPSKPPRVDDREYFGRAREERRLVFGLPVFSRLTGERLFPVVMPLTLPDGSFGGVAYANTTQARLMEVFSSLKLGPGGVITLLEDRRYVLARYPALQDAPDGQPRQALSETALAAVNGPTRMQTFRGRSALDGKDRTVTLRRIGNYPIYVVVGLSLDDYLAPWRQEVWIGAVFLCLLAGGSAALVVGVRRHWERETEVKALQASRAAHDHLAAVLAAIPDALFEMDVYGRIKRDPAGTLSLAQSRTLAGRLLAEQLPAEARHTLAEALAEACDQGFCYGTQLQLSGPSGVRWYELSIARKDTQGQDEPTLIVLSRDVTERRQAEVQIERLAFSDLLTQLPNRRLFLDRLHQSMAASQRNGQLSALLFLDLDHFKTVNDTMGHQHGDQLLVQTAQRLRLLVREGDTVARLGGDEFVVVLEQLGDTVEAATAQAMTVAEKVVQQLGDEYSLGGRLYRSTVSVGVTLLRGHEVSQDELLKRADMAMYQAKTAGRNAVRFFDPQSQALFEARLALENELMQAVAHEEFVLYFQPQIDADGHCTGAEALIRWHSPKRGLVLPGEFIGLAEETGLIGAIGLWVLRAACQQLAQWQQVPALAALTLSVNVSARQFARPGFVQEVQHEVKRHHIDPVLLKLELTESMLADQLDDVAAKMRELRSLGLVFSLDDFGTGFSSLSYLKRLPFAQLKIDRAFVRDILTDPNDAAICHAVLALGNSLGIEVIAEGVETPAQWQLLRQAGCRHAQGYLIGRPMPAADLAQWVGAARSTVTLLSRV